jgi:hypothetical protein
VLAINEDRCNLLSRIALHVSKRDGKMICTASPVTMMRSYYQLAALIALAVLPLTTGGCERRSPVKPSQAPSTITASKVVIGGLNPPVFTIHLRPGETARLTATAVLADSTSIDCTPIAQWSTSDAQILRFERSGEAIATGPGDVTVTALCGGAQGELSVRVGYVARGVIRQPDGQPVAGAAIRDVSPGAFRVASTDVDGTFRLPNIWTRELDLEVTAFGYEDAAHRIVWDGSAEMTGIVLTLQPRRGIRILETSGKICGCQPGSSSCQDPYLQACVAAGALRSEDRYDFRVPRDGTLHVGTFWSEDYNNFLFIQLRCNGSIVHQTTQHMSSAGKAFEIPARTTCAYELKLTVKIRSPYLAYKLRIMLEP